MRGCTLDSAPVTVDEKIRVLDEFDEWRQEHAYSATTPDAIEAYATYLRDEDRAAALEELRVALEEHPAADPARLRALLDRLA